MKSRDVSMIAVAAASLALAFGAVANEGSLQTNDRVTATEMDAAQRSRGGGTPAPAKRSPETIDTDHDGVITEAEHEAASRECSRIRTSTATAIVRKRGCRPGHQAGEQRR
jgi:hypothetical protein